MREATIDMKKIREALPKRADVRLIKYKGKSPAIEVNIDPSLSENDFEMCKQWQREIIGTQNISEFYTEETGRHWYVFFARIILSFENTTDEDKNTFVGMNLVKDGKLIK